MASAISLTFPNGCTRERCIYCLPRELQEWLPRSEILTYDEIIRLVRVATELGVTKVRVTRSEPLTRRNILELFRQLSRIQPVRDIGLSTNGSLLAKTMEPGETVAQTLVRLRVRSVNISLDTLDRENYQPGRKMAAIDG